MIEHTFPIAEQLITNATLLAQRLYLQLTQESDSLARSPQAGFISVVARNKRDLVTQLDMFNKQLEQILVAEKLPSSLEGIDAYFTKVAITGVAVESVRDKWQQLMRLCNDCKQLNEQNGASIEILARNTKRTLHILKGKSEVVTSYGPDGAVISDFSSRTRVSV